MRVIKNKIWQDHRVNSAAAVLLFGGLGFGQLNIFLKVGKVGNPGAAGSHSHIEQLLGHLLERHHHIFAGFRGSLEEEGAPVLLHPLLCALLAHLSTISQVCTYFKPSRGGCR